MNANRKWRIVSALAFAAGVLNLCPSLAHGQASEDAKFIVSPDVKPRNTPGAFSSVTPPLSLGQEDLLTIRNLKKQSVPYAEVAKIYWAAWLATRREFGNTAASRPRLTLVLGAKNNILDYPSRQIQLTKWDKYQFAQGVVVLAFEDLLSPEERIKLTSLAVNLAGATVDVGELKNPRTEEKNGK